MTMDDIADAAGVSRRTLFRHFESRERLIAESLEAGIQLYGELLPTFEGGWNAWLEASVTLLMRCSGYGPATGS